MLLRKLFRTAWKYKAQFISMIVMVVIGVGVFLGFNIEWCSIENDTNEFFCATKYADFRVYNDNGFSQEELKKIQNIQGVDSATRFLSVNVDVKNSDKKLALMVSENYTVSTMFHVSGKEYKKDGKGIWLSDRFAETNGYKIGDTLTLSYMGKEITGKIAGLCKSGEMMICTADKNQLMPDFGSFGFAYISPVTLEDSLGVSFYPQINIISDMDKESLETAIKDALGKTFMVVPKTDHMSYKGAQSESTEGKTMAAILPVLFLAIGILTMVTTMHRIAANEKVQIGTLKALGFKDRKILAHYTSYGFAIGIVGVGIGVLIGYSLARIILTPSGMMGTYFDLPDWKLVMPAFCIPVILLTVLFLTLISFLSVKKMLKGTAADALRPYMPKAMKKSSVERLSLWQMLPFGTKWNIRDVLRHKARSVMTLIGVIGCMLLLVGGLGMKDTMDGFMGLLNQTIPYVTKINLTETSDNNSAIALSNEVDGDWSASTGINFNGKTVTLEVYDISNGHISFIDEHNNNVNLTDDGAYLCLRLSDTAKIGDTIEFSPYGSDKTYAVKVAGYLRSVLAENIVMTNVCAGNAGISYHIDSVYTQKAMSEVDSSSIIASKQDKDSLIKTYDTFMQVLDIMVWMFVFGAVILGIVVLYNLGVMSYIERSRELATLKVLGFRDKKIGKLLISQNVWLTVIGVLIGLPGGVGVLQLIIELLGDEYELKLRLGPLTYIVSVLVTFGVSVVVGLMVARKNRKINMVEALKDAE